MMKLIPHVRSVADQCPTAKDNAVVRLKAANARNMVLKYVAPFVQANLSAHTKRLYRL